MQTKYLRHRHGGRIIAIDAIGHDTYKGVASWHFVGHVKWEDGSESPSSVIEPFLICTVYEDGTAGTEECNAYLEGMNDYLREHGKWHEPKSARDGRRYTWTPTKPKHQQPIEAFINTMALA